MVDSFGAALRSLREAHDMSQRGLATKGFLSKSLVAAVEAGTKPPSADFAAACDVVFGTTPLLATLAAIGGDDVRRRALLAHAGSAATLGAAGSLAELVRAGLLDLVEVTPDLDALVAEYRHRLTVDGSTQFGSSLLAQLMVLRQRLQESGGSAELRRAVAGLGQVYGLWLGNTGDLLAANGWYYTAGVLAASSGDQQLTSYVVGRAASRGIYEGWTVRRTMDDAERALALAKGAPWDGALEAYAAEVHVHALTGDTRAGRRAVGSMRAIAEQTGDQAAVARTTALDVFAESRYGTVESTQRAFEAARSALGPHPLWLAETRVYLGRAHTAAGDVDHGAGLALRAIASNAASIRVVGVAVRDLVHAAPADTRSDALSELARYADPAPGPWETLR